MGSWLARSGFAAAAVAALAASILFWGPIVYQGLGDFRYNHHWQSPGQIEVGYACKTTPDCASGSCRPGPRQGSYYCTTSPDFPCGYPGRGAQEGTRWSYEGVTYECRRPGVWSRV